MIAQVIANRTTNRMPYSPDPAAEYAAKTRNPRRQTAVQRGEAAMLGASRMMCDVPTTSPQASE